MRVIEQLIDHLRGTGHLTAEQLGQLRAMGLMGRELEDYEPGPMQPLLVLPAPSHADELDEMGDRLLATARRAGPAGRRGGRKRGAAREAEVIKAAGHALAHEGPLCDLLLEVARRIDPHVDAGDAPALVASADPGELDGVLVRDSLWAKIWAHADHEPIIARLGGGARRRFSRLLAGGGTPGIRAPRATDAVLQRAVAVVDAHRELCAAFGRVMLAIDPWRVVGELLTPLKRVSSGDCYEAYWVAVILFSAHTVWQSIGEIPLLPTEVSLPGQLLVPSTQNWNTAARIAPVAVLPFWQRWEEPSTLVPEGGAATCRRLRINNNRKYFLRQTDAGWFGIDGGAGKGTSRVLFTPHADAQPWQLSGTIDVDGVEYVHTCTEPDCRAPKWFYQEDSGGRLFVNADDPETHGYHQSRYMQYPSLTWGVGMLDVPLLTCPKQWEVI